MQDLPIPENSLDNWACQIIAKERSWEHTRRKRRLAQQIALKRAKGEDGECSRDMYAEETSIKTENDTKNPREESSDKALPDKEVPLLVCKLWVETESPDDAQDIITQFDKIFKMWMIFENGHGGLDALNSLRQYLINKLGVREKILDNPSKCDGFSKRKKKILKKNVDGSKLQSQSDNGKDLTNNKQDAENSKSS